MHSFQKCIVVSFSTTVPPWKQLVVGVLLCGQDVYLVNNKKIVYCFKTMVRVSSKNLRPDARRLVVQLGYKMPKILNMITQFITAYSSHLELKKPKGMLLCCVILLLVGLLHISLSVP